MRILVLGGTKFVGPHVVRQLAANGHETTIFHRGVSETELPEGVRHIHGDFATFDTHLDELKHPDGLKSPEVVLDMVPFREEDAAHYFTSLISTASRVWLPRASARWRPSRE